MKHKTELIIILTLIYSTLILSQIQFFYGLLKTPSGSIFLGTTHFPPDYFYYLSQLAQGKSHVLFSTILYETSKMVPVLVGWQNVLLGKILFLLGFSVVWGYRAAMVVYLTIFLLLSYKLICKIFPENKYKRILTFFFFISSNCLALPSIKNGQFTWTVSTYWYNTGEWFVRFGSTPHHMLANILLVAGLLLYMTWLESEAPRSYARGIFPFKFFWSETLYRPAQRDWYMGKKKNIAIPVGFVLIGLTLASITPVYWVILVLTAAFAPLFTRVFYASIWDALARLPHSISANSDLVSDSNSSRRRIKGIHSLRHVFLPSLLLFFSGLPAALYVKSVFSIPPYSLSAYWEASQLVHVNLYWMVVGSGLIIPLGFIGCIALWKKVNLAKITGVTLIGVSAVFYFSFIPSKLHLTNARFWPGAIYIFLAALACEGVYVIVNRWKKHRRVVFSIILGVYLASTLPTYIVQFRERLQFVDNEYFYIPKDVYDAYRMSEKLSKEDNIFLLPWPYNESFPALTGRKTFFGYRLFTIYAEAKGRYTSLFYSASESGDDMMYFLKRYNIDFVLAFTSQAHLQNLPFLKKVYSNNLMVLYKVDKTV